MKASFTPRVNLVVFAFLLSLFGSVAANAQCPQLHAAIANGPLVNMCSSTPVILKSLPTSASSYQWQRQADAGGAFQNINEATAESYSASELGAYRVIVGNGTCYDTSGITSLVHLQLVPGTISGGPTTPICVDSYVGSMSGPSVAGDEAGIIKYQWQLNEAGGGYQDIPLANGLEYNAGYVRVNTKYRRAVIDNCGNTVYSNEISVVISDVATSGTLQPEEQTIPAGSIPAAISDAVAATGAGNLSYQWQQSLSINGPWVTINGATSASYTPGPVNLTTFYRRITTSDVCGTSATSQPVFVSILNPVILNAGILYSDNSCLFIGNTPYPIGTKIKPSGGVLPYLVEWEAKTAAGDWTVVAGEHSEKLYPGPITQTTKYRKKVTDATGTFAYSDTATLSVISEPLDAGMIATTVSVACLGSSPGQIISAKSGANFGERGSYQWQVKSGEGEWENIPGATRGYYQPQPLTANSLFRRVFNDFCGPNGRVAYSNEVMIEIKPALIAGEISPSTQFVLPGRAPRQLKSLAAPSGGTNAYTIWWEKATVAAGPFVKINGATGLDYQPPVADQTTYYRRVVRDNNCLAEKVSYVIEVFVPDYPALVGGALNGSTCVFPGLKPAAMGSGTVAPAGGIGPYTFEWESRTGNAAFATIANATGETYQPTALSQTTQFRRKMTDAYGTTAYSDTFTIQLISTALVPGKIAVENTSICAGVAPGIIKSIEGASGYGENGRYQWQQRTETGSFVDIAGANSADYTPQALMQTMFFRRAFSDGCSGINRVGYSNEVMIKATPATELLPGLIQAPFITCAGTAPSTIQSVLNACGSCNLIYQWQVKDGDTWQDIAGADGAGYTPDIILNATKYRRKVTDGMGRTAYSNEVEILVYPGISAGTIGIDSQVVCKSATPAAIALLTDCHYTDGSVTYQWQSASSATGPWSDIDGATTPVYNPAAAVTNTYYRLKVSSTTCAAVVYTNVAVVLIKDVCSAQISSSSTTVSNCQPINNVALTYPVQDCNAQNILEWEYQVGSATTWTATGTGTNNFAINTFYQTGDTEIKWRLKMTNTSCNSISYSNVLTITQSNCRSTDGPVVYPNPTSPGHVIIVRSVDKPHKFALMTIDGKRLEVKVLSAIRGVMRLQIPASIPSGTYVLHISTADNQWVEKILVKNK